MIMISNIVESYKHAKIFIMQECHRCIWGYTKCTNSYRCFSVINLKTLSKAKINPTLWTIVMCFYILFLCTTLGTNNTSCPFFIFVRKMFSNQACLTCCSLPPFAFLQIFRALWRGSQINEWLNKFLYKSQAK